MLGVYESRRLTAAAETISIQPMVAIWATCCVVATWKRKLGQSLLLFNVPEGTVRARLLLVGCGRSAVWTIAANRLLTHVATALNDTGATEGGGVFDRSCGQGPRSQLENPPDG